MSANTQIQPFKSPLDDFVDKVGRVNSKLTSNINNCKQIYLDRINHMKEVMGYEIRGAYGRMIKHLIGFALDPNWWSVCAYQCKKRKIPFVIQEKTLRKLIYTYNHIKILMDNNEPNDDTIDGHIRAFEYSIVRDVSSTVAFNSETVDYNAHWRSQYMSFGKLSETPLKFHKIWKDFFTDRTIKCIPLLINDIERILTFHTKTKSLNYSTHCNFVNLENIINESTNILKHGKEFLNDNTNDGGSDENIFDSVSIDDIQPIDGGTTTTGGISESEIDEEIIKALYYEEDLETSDDDDDDDDGDDSDYSDSPTKRKAIMQDPSPITNMMKTVIQSVKRQKTDDDIEMGSPRNSIITSKT
jgi:hypothetical protein